MNRFIIGYAVLAVALIVALIVDIVEPVHAQVFGTYSQAYLDRQHDRKQLERWKQLCKGSGRYQAMGEAYDVQKPDPCNSQAKVWVK